jgi:hypothetical protein
MEEPEEEITEETATGKVPVERTDEEPSNEEIS